MTSVNGYHATVNRWLDDLGIQYTEEYPVGPYHLDTYIPDIKVGVEVDGPQHSKAKDAIRDAIILAEFGIEVRRVKVGTKKRAALEAIFGEHFDSPD